LNFLAHAWLARGGSDAFLLGNLVADGIKGSDLSAWPAPFAEGVRHHRRVDAFVDRHDTVRGALERTPKGQRRFAGIALDLVWDHFAARQLPAQERDTLICRCYRLMGRETAPARLASMVPVLIEQDWLHRYADFGFTCRAICGIGTRLRGPNRLAELIPHLEDDYPRLERDFEVLWPSVNAACGLSLDHG